MGVIPVFINNYNRLTTTKNLVEQLMKFPKCLPIIIDNASTYPPLLDWYADECAIEVMRLSSNMGKLAPWMSGRPQQVEQGYYAVTDSDLDLSSCPADMFGHLLQGFEKYPETRKVGLSLEINDLPEYFYLGKDYVKAEQKQWAKPVDDEFFDAPIDTTFGVYRSDIDYWNPDKSIPWDLSKCLRSNRPYTARHMPWYLNLRDLDDEERYYLRNATRAGRGIRNIRRVLGIPAAGNYFDIRLRPESTWTPSRNGMNTNFWNAADGNSGEIEVHEFLYSLVRLLKSQNVLETGTWKGYGAMYIAAALQHNWDQSRDCRGHVITVEHKEAVSNSARQLSSAHGLAEWITFLVGDTHTIDLRKRGPFDLLFLDCRAAYKHKALENCKRTRVITEETLVVYHDTGPNKSNIRAIVDGLVDRGEVTEILHLPTPRGVSLMKPIWK